MRVRVHLVSAARGNPGAGHKMMPKALLALACLAAANLPSGVLADEEAQRQCIQQSLDLPREQRNQTLAEMRDKGELRLESAKMGDPDPTIRQPLQCISYEKNDAGIARMAATRASSGTEFLEAEAHGPHMTVTEVRDIEGVSHVVCSWFDKTKQEGGAFPSEAVHVPPSKAVGAKPYMGGGGGSGNDWMKG